MPDIHPKIHHATLLPGGHDRMGTSPWPARRHFHFRQAQIRPILYSQLEFCARHTNYRSHCVHRSKGAKRILDPCKMMKIFNHQPSALKRHLSAYGVYDLGLDLEWDLRKGLIMLSGGERAVQYDSQSP